MEISYHFYFCNRVVENTFGNFSIDEGGVNNMPLADSKKGPVIPVGEESLIGRTSDFCRRMSLSLLIRSIARSIPD
jgi:hypothetical protein